MDAETPLELLHRDCRVAQAWADDKLVRQASHALLRTWVAQLEQVVPQPVSRCLLPPEVLVGALQDTDLNIVNVDDGTPYIVNRRTHEVVPVFPSTFTATEDIMVINHVLDRGSVGLCAMNFCQDKGLLWTPTWGIFHDMWNSVKTAAKLANGGDGGCR